MRYERTIEDYIGTHGEYWQREAERLLDKFDDATVDSEGVARWKSNGSVPPDDILALWAYCEKPFNAAKSVEAREKDVERELAEYRKAQENRQPSAEERAEMAAAFGHGTVVVDVLTGRKFTV